LRDRCHVRFERINDSRVCAEWIGIGDRNGKKLNDVIALVINCRGWLFVSADCQLAYRALAGSIQSRNRGDRKLKIDGEIRDTPEPTHLHSPDHRPKVCVSVSKLISRLQLFYVVAHCFNILVTRCGF
jgi:hypothetical protein